MNLFVVGLNHRTAPVEVREQVAVPVAELEVRGARLRQGAGLDEVVVLSTCNRIEIYGVSLQPPAHLRSLFDDLSGEAPRYRPHLYVHQGLDAARHLFAVTSGLDSMVLGENEIVGQVKLAYEKAHEAGLTGRVLNRLFQTALQSAKEVRTRTGIGLGATSVGSVAATLAERIFGSRSGAQTILILGAGKMGEACVRHLAKRCARTILVSNRSFERAAELAAAFGGQAIPFEHCLDAMVDADIVVSSTGSPQTILHRPDLETVMRARRNRPLVLIDIAVPRDIDPTVQSIDNVYLFNIDHLEEIVRENLRLREQQIAQGHAIIDDKIHELTARLSRATHGSPDTSVPAEPNWLVSGAAACPG